MSDGNPSLGLDQTTQDNWDAFVNDPTAPINVTAIGVGNYISLASLEEIDVDGNGDVPVLLADYITLGDALVDRVDAFVQAPPQAGVIIGNVLEDNGNGADMFGADGMGAMLQSRITGSPTPTTRHGHDQQYVQSRSHRSRQWNASTLDGSWWHADLPLRRR